MSTIDVSPPRPGTVQVWSDLLCPFAHVLLHTWRRARDADPGLAGVTVEHRSFALELFNGPHPRRGTDTEAVGLGQIAPEAGFRVWTQGEDTYPHTVLLAAEAVRAAGGSRDPGAGEALDAALREAFWTRSQSISHRAVILEIAEQVAAARPAFDLGELTAALDDGRWRAALMRDHLLARGDTIPGSPTVVLPDGSVVHNPGIEVHWEGPWAAGFPIVDVFDPDAQIDVLRRAVPPSPLPAGG